LPKGVLLDTVVKIGIRRPCGVQAEGNQGLAGGGGAPAQAEQLTPHPQDRGEYQFTSNPFLPKASREKSSRIKPKQIK
jgi:hypothetical protein